MLRQNPRSHYRLVLSVLCLICGLGSATFAAFYANYVFDPFWSGVKIPLPWLFGPLSAVCLFVAAGGAWSMRMSLREKTPEQIAASGAIRLEQEERRRVQREERKQRAREAAEQQQAAQFSNTPAGLARAARAAGAHIFQIALPLSTTTASVLAMVGAFANTSTGQHASVLDSIEAQGWKIEHVGYVYRVTGSESRDKFLASGQQEAYSGELVGVYLFRVVNEPIPNPPAVGGHPEP